MSNYVLDWKLLELGKTHSDGTPIRQLKWDSSILPIFEQLMEAS